MTRDDIIRMAREVGLWPAVTDMFPKELERFAALVAVHAAAKEREWMQDINKRLIAEAVAAEREACAKLCEWKTGLKPVDTAIETCAAAIRARSES